MLTMEGRFEFEGGLRCCTDSFFETESWGGKAQHRMIRVWKNFLSCSALTMAISWTVTAFAAPPSIAILLSNESAPYQEAMNATLTVLDSGNRQYKIRLSAIDAPEKNQPFGMRSKQALSSLCYGKEARVSPLKADRHGRTVADVDCGGKNVNEEQIRSGMAWVYRRYAEGYGDLYRLEDEAREDRRGLWVDAEPMPPWDWRHNRKND